jgi:uncharacterized repeat protein (TIGR01451 family)
VTWYLTTVPAHTGSVTLSFRVTLDSTFPSGTTTIHNTATANTPGVGETPSNETTVTVTGEPNLGLHKSADNSTVSTGQQITYTLEYFNDSDFDATDVTITEPIPPGTEFVGCSDSCDGDPDGPITWTIASVPGHTTEADPAGFVTLTVEVTDNVNCTICNVATIASPDQNGGTPVDSNQVCVTVAQGTSGASSEAFGLSVSAPPVSALLSLPDPLVAPTPSTEDPGGNPTTVLEVPADPVAHAQVLHVEKSSGIDATNAHADALATTGKVELIDPAGTGDWLVTATAVQAMSSSVANGSYAGSTDAGSYLEGVTVAGQNFDTITEPTTITLIDPALNTTTTVKFLEQNGSGAKSQIPQPVGNTMSSDLEVNAIHVTVTDGSGDVVTDVIVAHAKSAASFPSIVQCGEAPHVSGLGFSLGVQGDEDLVDSSNQLVNGEVGRVVLPSTGSGAGDEFADDSTQKHIGPITDSPPTITVAESNTAFSHTEGAVDLVNNTASALTYSQIEGLTVLDNGTAPSNPLISADLVRAEAHANASGSGAASSGTTTLLRPKIAGVEVCVPVIPGDTCSPAPNTIVLGIPDAVVILNEQLVGTGVNAASITVNAIHVFIVGDTNPFGLPADAEIIVASAHADAVAAGSAGTGPETRAAGTTVIEIPLPLGAPSSAKTSVAPHTATRSAPAAPVTESKPVAAPEAAPPSTSDALRGLAGL